MLTFKQFIEEGATRKTHDGIIYSGPSGHLTDEAILLHDRIKKVASELKLEQRFKNAALHASLYADGNGARLLNLKVPVPDGLDGDGAVFFMKMVRRSVANRLGNPHGMALRTKARAFIQHEYISSQVNRRKKPETDGDTLDIDVYIPRDIPEWKDDRMFEGVYQETRAKMLPLREAIAKALKISRFKVQINRSVMQEAGLLYVLKLDIPSDQDSDFYSRMVERLLRRELTKLFDRFKITENEVVKYTGSSGVKVDTLYVRFYVPDADGLLP